MSDPTAQKPPEDPKRQPLRQPKLVVSPDQDVAYANLVRIAHTPSEMLFDFARMLPGDANARVTSRVMMSPLSAKLFHRALAENLAKYEAIFGEVVIPSKPSGLADFLFRSSQPPSDEPPEPPPEE